MDKNTEKKGNCANEKIVGIGNEKAETKEQIDEMVKI